MKSYKDLEVYKIGLELFFIVHPSTLKLPKYELYELGSQVRRSSDSVVSNIVEGYGRRRYKADFIKRQAAYLVQYKQRISDMIAICRANNVTPILLTQPSLFGNFTDSATMINMGNKILPGTAPVCNAALMANVLELYNDVVRSFGNQVKVVDLATLMPKNSNYYYDFIHYTNAGCGKIGAILSKELVPWFKMNN